MWGQPRRRRFFRYPRKTWGGGGAPTPLYGRGLSATCLGIFARRALVGSRTPMILCLSNVCSGGLHFGTSFVALRAVVREKTPNTIHVYILFYKFSSNVCLGRFAGISAFTKHSLLCWSWPHHPIAQFQCYGRIVSERLTCPVDWTRSPPPTHALWPLCGSCHKDARHYA